MDDILPLLWLSTPYHLMQSLIWVHTMQQVQMIMSLVLNKFKTVRFHRLHQIYVSYPWKTLHKWFICYLLFKKQLSAPWICHLFTQFVKHSCDHHQISKRKSSSLKFEQTPGIKPQQSLCTVRVHWSQSLFGQ